MPIAPERYKIQFTASRDAYEQLRRAQALLRHVIPDGDPAAVFERALDALLADLEKRKLAATTRPRQAQRPAPGSRHVPAAVRREVWHRDGARCAFVGTNGRCAERGFLELHHVVPFAAGGPSDAVARVLAEAMRGPLGQTLTVENVAGAGGTLGTTRTARATPDGYTVMVGLWGTHVVNPVIYTLPYDVPTSFEPSTRSGAMTPPRISRR